jgi:hypothetical protein
VDVRGGHDSEDCYRGQRDTDQIGLDGTGAQGQEVSRATGAGQAAAQLDAFLGVLQDVCRPPEGTDPPCRA